MRQDQTPLRNAYNPHLAASSPLLLGIRLRLHPQTIAIILNLQYGTLSIFFHVHLFQNQNFTRTQNARRHHDCQPLWPHHYRSTSSSSAKRAAAPHTCIEEYTQQQTRSTETADANAVAVFSFGEAVLK